MGSVGETVEEIIAEEEDPGYVEAVIGSVTALISGYGWYILAGGAAAYYVWKNYGPKYTTTESGAAGAGGKRALSAAEAADFQRKEEARQRYIAKIQEQYEKDAIVKAERVKQLDDEKRAARLAEVDRLAGKEAGGHKLGDGAGSSTSVPKSESKAAKSKSAQSFRPEYNPLMSDTRSSRFCSSRGAGGRAGGWG